MDFESLLHETFLTLRTEYHLVMHPASDKAIWLDGSTYFLVIGYDREGVYVSYFAPGQERGYDMLAFLFDQRSHLLVINPACERSDGYREFIGLQLSAIARHLLTAGQDILQGEREWQRAYKFGRVDLNEVCA